MSLVELLDPSFVKDCLKNVSDSTSPPDGSPPPRGMLVHGFDGTYARRIKTDADGSLLVKTV
ncbi:MAG: hypothetical protein QXR74_07395 [Candidatus Bathyarchaeia archaeon]